MPRDGNGGFVLPAGNPVVAGTVVTDAWANSTIADLANEIANSMTLDGQTPLIGPLKFPTGSVSEPVVTFNVENNTGLYRPALQTLAVTVNGNEKLRVTNAAVQPGSNNNTTLGASGLRWSTVYATTLDATSLTGNAATASKWATARTLTLDGDVSGSVSVDGSANVTLTATVADDSHNHIISNVDGLQTALDGKLALAGGTMTGDIVYGASDRDHSPIGTYDAAKTQQIWAMGASYRSAADGTNFGSLYGLAYKPTNNATGGTMAGGHQVVWCSAGTPKAALGDNIWTAGVFSGTATSARYADLAEKYRSDAVYAPGTVVRIGGSAEITLEKRQASTNVFGVISTAPGIMLNAGAGEDTDEIWLYVALNGRVPVRVVGSVKKGDFLVSASNGCARVASSKEVKFNTKVGIALEDKDGDDEALLLVAVR